MIDQKHAASFSSLALDWARTQEEIVLKHGAPLGPRQLEDAKRAGVNHPERVRILAIDRIPMPENRELADAAMRAQILTHASLAVTVGYGIIIRAERWQDRELILHQLVHIAQCEQAGGLENFVEQYLNDRASANFSLGAIEEEARRRAREICAETAAPKKS